MFEIAEQFMVQLVYLIPPFIGLWIMFDFIACILFDRRY